jgi:hypothetical protein
MFTKKCLLLVAVVAGLLFVITPAYATKVDPCPGCDSSFKIEDFGYLSDTYGVGNAIALTDFLEVTIQNEYSFDWEVTDPSVQIFAVLVKGGSNTDTYSYDEGSTSDTGLYVRILNRGGQQPALSNATFCYTKVPEPATMLLLGLGLTGLGILGRRKARSN